MPGVRSRKSFPLCTHSYLYLSPIWGFMFLSLAHSSHFPLLSLVVNGTFFITAYRSTDVGYRAVRPLWCYQIPSSNDRIIVVSYCRITYILVIVRLTVALSGLNPT